MRRPWTLDALCVQVGWQVFYPDNAEDEHELREAARATCRTCPVQPSCLEYALASEWGESKDYRWGIWAGLGPAARMRVERQWREEGRVPAGAREPWERRRDLAVAAMKRDDASENNDITNSDNDDSNDSNDSNNSNGVTSAEGEDAA